MTFFANTSCRKLVVERYLFWLRPDGRAVVLGVFALYPCFSLSQHWKAKIQRKDAKDR